MNEPVAELVLEQMAVGDASSLRVKWLTDTYPPVGTKLYTHPVNPKYDPETGEPLIDGYPLFSGLPHPVKELTREERSKLIGTLKWAEDLLREAGHDEAVSDVQDCLMILRKAQEK